MEKLIKNILAKSPQELVSAIYHKGIELVYTYYEKKIISRLKIINEYPEYKVKILNNRKLINLLLYAKNNTVYYSNLFENNQIDCNNVTSIKRLPILTKDIIRKNTDQLISKKFSKKQLLRRNTGGSTGEPLEFYSDRYSGHIDNAHHWYLYSLMGYKKGNIIFDSGGVFIPKNLRKNNIYWLQTHKNSVWGEYVFSALYITELNIDYYIEKLLEVKPSIIRGYPSFIDKLASYIIKEKIIIDFKIKGINLTAEMSTIAQRLNIGIAFKSKIYFEYGHSEICVFCYTHDDDYIYKSSPIYGYIEVLDEKGNDVKEGDVGKIIVSGFNNLGMPFIRYDTGDIGEVSYRNGGIIHFKKIHGRSQDYIISKNGQKVLLTALIFGQHLIAFKNIIKWQLIQNEIGKIHINIVRNESYNMEDENEILFKFQTVMEIDLVFNYVKDIPLTKRGKHLFLIQNIKESK